MALPFSDNFNRADSNTVGNNWSENEIAAANCRILSNKLREGNATSGAIQSVYQDIGANNGLKVTGKFKVTHNAATGRETHNIITFLSSSGSAGVGVNFIKRGSDGSGDAGNFFRISIVDVTQKSLTSKNSLSDATGDIEFEIIINTDYSMEVRVWLASDSRPATADATQTAFTPTSSGSNFSIGFASVSSPGATVDFDDISVTSTAVTLNSNFLAFM